MRTLTSSIDHNLDRIYPDFEDTFGFGPCGAYAALRREQGWGDIAVCIARFPNGVEFTHYILIDDGIIDLTNPTGEELTYHEIDILNADEMPELCDSPEPIDWLRERI